MSCANVRRLLVALMCTWLSAVPAPALGQAGTLSEEESMRRCPVKVPPGVMSAEVFTIIRQLQSKPAETKDAIVVPVYVHILQSSSGSNPVTPTHISRTIQVLNRAFVKAGFQFRLQSTETVVNNEWAVISETEEYLYDEIAGSENTGVRRGVNVYIGQLEGLCGIADLPYSENPNEALFLSYDCMVGGRLSNDTDTIAHEMGHFMGLLHTFAPEPNGCRGNGDGISDTPFEKVEHYQCRRYDTCPTKPGLDPVQNFMDYTGDDCNHVFTTRQMVVMRAAHRKYRING